jgi:PAS domain S-box-containing protein
MDVSLLGTVPGLIYRISATPPFDVEFVSEELASLTGYAAEQFLGPEPDVRWIDLVHPDDVPRAYNALLGAGVGQLAELEFRYRRPDGGEGWLFTRARKLQDDDGTTWMHGAAIDVTERHNAEALRRRAEAEHARRAEVESSRARIVAAGDEARRRLERDLHDGAQQRFVSAALTLAYLERRVARDPEGVGEILAEARKEIDKGLDELRELARGVHPAILGDHGLAAALDALAERTPLPVRLHISLDERPPESVEITAYFVVAESLTNVAKHAAASSAEVEVVYDGRLLTVSASDDGIGGARLEAGSGLRGLADRVETLGGRLTLASEPGAGTVVRAELPANRA